MQEGPDGNSDTSPTYWFEHPLVGHANASRIYDSWLHLTGHGEVGMVNIAPGRSGKLRESYLPVMTAVGKAIRDTFSHPLAYRGLSSGSCAVPLVLEVPLPAQGQSVDYIETKEDLTHSQRIMNYTIEYRVVGSSPTSGPWLTLVPAVGVAGTGPDAADNEKLGDRPAGADPRDSHVGFRRIDVPSGSAALAAAAGGRIAAVRFRCLRSIGKEIFLASLALYKKALPWES